MNSYHTLAERRKATKALLKQANDELTNSGVFEQLFNDCTPDTPMDVALEKAREKMNTEDLNVKSVNKGFITEATKLQINRLPIGKLRRKHIKGILESIQKNNSRFTNNTWNHYLRYLRMVFTELVDMEAVEANYIKDIRKKKITKKKARVVTEEELITILKFLRENYYAFYRFIRIFLCSGGREIELLSTEVQNVDLEKQEYTVLVRKRKAVEWVTRPIVKNALPFWKEVLEDIEPGQTLKNGDYVFSIGLKPGSKKIRREQVTRRWEVHVKEKLGIESDLYKLKHLFTTYVVGLLNNVEAAKLNGHTNTKMVDTVYDVKAQQRKNDLIKTVDVNLLPESF